MKRHLAQLVWLTESAAVFRASAWITTLIVDQEPIRKRLDPETNVVVPRPSVLLGGAIGLAAYRRWRHRRSRGPEKHFRSR